MGLLAILFESLLYDDSVRLVGFFYIFIHTVILIVVDIPVHGKYRNYILFFTTYVLLIILYFIVFENTIFI